MPHENTSSDATQVRIYITCIIEERIQTDEYGDEVPTWEINEFVIDTGKVAKPFDSTRKINNASQSFFEAELIDRGRNVLHNTATAPWLFQVVQGCVVTLNSLLKPGIQTKEGLTAGDILKELFERSIEVAQDRSSR